MEPFKNLISPAKVEELASCLRARGLDHVAFTRHALHGLEEREMKARAELIAEALCAVLPSDFAQAADLLESLLAPLEARESDASSQASNGVSGWLVWPLTMVVATLGAAHPERALRALHAMTQRFTSEFAVRTFVRDHPAITYRTLRQWLADPSPHVRRLVSEGTRPRLPWGMRLGALVLDPSPTLPLLEQLRDDPSEYVRRSVANHLNDIAKDHPDRFADVLEAWLVGAPAPRVRLLQHASRTLIKQGHPRVLRAFGVHRALRGTAAFRATPRRLTLGGALTLELALVSTATSNQKLVIDYVMHHRKKDGSTSPKVFKGWNLELGPLETRTLRRSHAMRPITTRSYYSGEHAIECLVNGRSVGSHRFVLVVPEAAAEAAHKRRAR